MKSMPVIFLSILIFFCNCQKENIKLANNVSETFYVKNEGASMRVLMEGNTASKIIIVIVHGGPGSTAYLYHTDYIRNHIEDKFAVAYWDQRNSGASQGNNNGNKLVLDQYVDDLKKVIEVIKYRYGSDVKIFLMGHSFGGLVTTAFLTKNNYQSLVRGWICVDGSHDYGLNDTLTRRMLLDVGQNQVIQNKHVSDWKPILDYCNTHPGNFTLEQSEQLGTYAENAETFIDSVHQINIVNLLIQNAVKDDIPLTSILFNYLFSVNSDLDEELLVTNFTSSLYKINVPTLLLWGKYDFVCPVGLANAIYSGIQSTQKSIVISPFSGHNFLLQDDSLFSASVVNFIDLNK